MVWIGKELNVGIKTLKVTLQLLTKSGAPLLDEEVWRKNRIEGAIRSWINMISKKSQIQKTTHFYQFFFLIKIIFT